MKRKVWTASVVVLVLVGGTGWMLAHLESIQRVGTPGVRVVEAEVYDPEGNVVGTNTVPLPENVPGYESRPVPIQQIVLDWLPPDTTYAQREYEADDGFKAWMNVVLMGTDRTSIHKPQYCLTGVGWRIDEKQTEITSIPLSEPHAYELPVMKMIVKRDVTAPDGRQSEVAGVFVYWFVADGQLTADHNQRMWWMARDLVGAGILQRWAYVSAFAVCYPGREDETFARLRGLIALTVPEFQLATGARRQMASRL